MRGIMCWPRGAEGERGRGIGGDFGDGKRRGPLVWPGVGRGDREKGKPQLTALLMFRIGLIPWTRNEGCTGFLDALAAPGVGGGAIGGGMTLQGRIKPVKRYVGHLGQCDGERKPFSVSHGSRLFQSGGTSTCSSLPFVCG
jgi:hypothetical protein